MMRPVKTARQSRVDRRLLVERLEARCVLASLPWLAWSEAGSHQQQSVRTEPAGWESGEAASVAELAWKTSDSSVHFGWEADAAHEVAASVSPDLAGLGDQGNAASAGPGQHPLRRTWELADKGTDSAIAPAWRDACVAGTALQAQGEGAVEVTADASKQIVGERFVVVGQMKVSSVEVAEGGVLGGQGAISGSIVVAEGGTLAPGNSPGIIESGDVAFRSTSTFEVEVEGVYAGTGYDQLNVQGTVSLGSARLKLLLANLTKSQVEGRELVIIKNDGTDPVTGQFVFARDAANVLLTVPRTLNEGDILLNSFANSGQTARITYQGGDGNDVAIRIDGPLLIDLVEPSRGDNVAIRRDGEQIVVEIDATEVLRRPVSDLGGIKLLGNAAGNRFMVNFANGDPIPAGGLRVEGGGHAGDQLELIQVGDRFSAHRYTYLNATEGSIELVENTTTWIDYVGLAPLSNDGTADAVELNLPDTHNPDVRLTAASTVGFMTLSGSTFADTTFVIPSTSLTIRGGNLNDNITVASVDPGYRAALLIDGKDGQDQVALESDLELAGRLALTAEQISLSALMVSTNRGSQSGTVSFRGDVLLRNGFLLNTDHPTGRDGSIQFTGRLDSEPAVARPMTLIAGDADIRFVGPVGAQVPLGIVQIASARNLSLPTFTAASLQQVTGTGSTVLTGDVTSTGRIDLNTARDLIVSPNLKITADSNQSGDEPLSFTAGRSIRVGTGSVVSTQSGNVTLRANVGGTGLESADAIVIDAATLSSARGTIELQGVAGQAGGNGVVLQAGARVVTAGSGNVTMSGTGRTTSSSDGVEIVDAGTLVQTANGNITITGRADRANGLRLRRQIVIESTGLGAVRLEGITTDQGEDGIEIQDAGTVIRAGDGGVTLVGNSQRDDGIDLSLGAELVVSGLGTLLLQGTSAAQHGVLLMAGVKVRATGNGNVRIEGTAAENAAQGIEIRDAETLVAADVGGVTMVGSSAGREGLLVERNALIRTTNSGGLTLQGTSSAAGGIRVRSQAIIQAVNFGIVRLTGTSTAPGGHGVEVEELDTTVQAGSGGVVLIGNANSGDGIAIKLGALVSATNSGSLTLRGTATQSGDDGVSIDGVGTRLTTANGGISVTGASENGDGIVVTGGAVIACTNGGTLFLRGDTTGIGDGLNIVAQSVVKTTNGGNISLTGTSTGADGLAIAESVVEAEAAGSISLSGTSDANDGIQLIGNTRIRTATGNVNMAGISNGVLTIDEGVYIRDSQVIGASGISLSGVSSAGSGIDLVNSQVLSNGGLQISGRTTANNFLFNGVRLFSSEGSLTPTIVSGRADIAITGQSKIGPAMGIINASTLRNAGTASILMQLITEGTTSLRMVGSQARIGTENGTISINGNGTMVLADNGRIVSEGASVSLNAYDTGHIVMADVASISAVNGVATLTAAGDVTLGGVFGIEARITAGGAIFDGGDTLADLTATRAALRSNGGIGSTNPLDTAISILAARNFLSGDLRIFNQVGGELTIGTVDGVVGVTNDGGTIEIINASPLTIADDVIATRDVTLVAADRPLPGDDLVINSTDSSGLGVIQITASLGDLVLSAGDEFVLPTTAVLSAGGTITLPNASVYFSANTSRLTGLKPQTTYRVSATWKADTTRSSLLPLRLAGVLGGDVELMVDQQSVPDDFVMNGVPYKELGLFRTTGTQLDVTWLDVASAAAAQSAFLLSEVLDAPPAMMVRSSSSLLQNATLDFGKIERGLDMTQRFSITNQGASPLTLAGRLSLPTGFLLGQVTPANLFQGEPTTLLADSSPATFEVRVDTTIIGAFSGSLSFTSNDEQASPLVLSLAAEVVEAFASTVQILDDGDPITAGPLAGSYTDSGNFRVFTGQGFQDDVREAAAGGTSKTATYTFSNLTVGGQYRLAATWTPFGNRTTAAPFFVSGAIENPTTVQINQPLAPRDFYDQGLYWNQLRTFRATGDSLTVTLTSVSDGTVIADAIRIERLYGPKLDVSLPNATLINGISQVQFPQVVLNGTVRRTFTIKNAGLAPLELPSTLKLPTGFRLVPATDPVNPPSPPTLFAPDSMTTSVPVGGSATFTIEVDSSLPGRYEGNLVFDNNDPNQSPFGIRLLAEVGTAVVIDDDDPSFTSDRSFLRYVGQGFQNDVRAKYLPRVGDRATWTVMGAPAGTYRVSATWSTFTDRATNAPYFIQSTQGTDKVGPLLVNQRLDANDPLAVPAVGTFVMHAATAFADLVTTYAHPGGDLIVTLTDTNINGWIAADAIRVERLSPLLLATPANASGTSSGERPDSVRHESTARIKNDDFNPLTTAVHNDQTGSDGDTPLAITSTDSLFLDAAGIASVSTDPWAVEPTAVIPAAVDGRSVDPTQVEFAEAPPTMGHAVDPFSSLETIPVIAPLTWSQVEPVLTAAVAYWTAIDETAAERLAAVQVQISDLPGPILGLGSHTVPTIWLDIDGAGQGWTGLLADAAGSSAQRSSRGESMGQGEAELGKGVDLLSTIVHELGHVLGYEDVSPERVPSSIMTSVLQPGTRRLPWPNPSVRSFESAASQPLATAEPVAARRIETLLESRPATAWDHFWADWAPGEAASGLQPLGDDLEPEHLPRRSSRL